MPSKSIKQQRFFYAVKNCKNGGKCTPELELVADKMSDTGIDDFTYLKPKKKRIKEDIMATVTIEKADGEYRVPAKDGYEKMKPKNKGYELDADKVIKESNINKIISKLKEEIVPHDRNVGRILKAQKALDYNKYNQIDIGYMSKKERKEYLDTLESKIEKEKKKGNLKDYVLSHLE